MLTEADFFDALDNHHVVTNRLVAFRLEHRCQALGPHPCPLGHLHEGLRGSHRRLAETFCREIAADLRDDGRVVGGDLVEVSPPFDTTGNTALIGANLLYEMLCVLPGVKRG